MTARALVKEADLARAIRAAKKHGAARVTIGRDGTIIFDMDKVEDQSAESPPATQDEPPRRVKTIW